MPHVVDNRLLGRMVRDAVGSARVDGTVNVALFELLLPNDLKRELASVENLVLVVDERTTADPVGGARRPQRRVAGSSRSSSGWASCASSSWSDRPRRTAGLAEAARARHR